MPLPPPRRARYRYCRDAELTTTARGLFSSIDAMAATSSRFDCRYHDAVLRASEFQPTYVMFIVSPLISLAPCRRRVATLACASETARSACQCRPDTVSDIDDFIAAIAMSAAMG